MNLEQKFEALQGGALPRYIKDLLPKLDKDLGYSNPTVRQWSTLCTLYNSLYKPNALTFVKDASYEFPHWNIKETCGDYVFEFTRHLITLERRSVTNDLGLIGFSSINPNDKEVIITEGVSDYFTAHILFPTNNVVGFTSLGGNNRAKLVVKSLFDKAYYIADSDSAGLGAARKIRDWFPNLTILTPLTCKDLSTLLMINLKKLKYETQG